MNGSCFYGTEDGPEAYSKDGGAIMYDLLGFE